MDKDEWKADFKRALKKLACGEMDDRQMYIYLLSNIVELLIDIKMVNRGD